MHLICVGIKIDQLQLTNMWLQILPKLNIGISHCIAEQSAGTGIAKNIIVQLQLTTMWLQILPKLNIGISHCIAEQSAGTGIAKNIIV